MSDTNLIFNNSANDNDEGEIKIGSSESSEVSEVSFGVNEVEQEEKNEETTESNEEASEEQKDEDEKEDVVVISKSKVVLIEKLLQNIKESNDKIIQLLNGSISSEDEARISISQVSDDSFNNHRGESEDEAGRIIEGVFDGENMIGPDGKEYSMPANYASKSKLVEGDIMKLTITDSGTFVYKQIGPIERRRVVGIIDQVENGNFVVVGEGGKKWRVLTASVTYYKGQSGDEAVILVPKNGDSKWAAVDNVVRNQD